LPHLWDHYLAQRVTTLQQITLSHGDCYLTQFLCPHNPASHTTFLVDFDSVSANFGAYDLVYLLPTFWRPEQRHRHEQPLLQQYWRALQQHGVNNYTWDDLLLDYRLMLCYMIFDPIWDHASGAAETYWRPKLHCLTAAYQDLACAELWQ
jgi:hypothetical protein